MFCGGPQSYDRPELTSAAPLSLLIQAFRQPNLGVLPESGRIFDENRSSFAALLIGDVLSSDMHMDTNNLLDRIAQGESSAAVTLLAHHQTRLRRMVSLRISPLLAARVDPSDIVQDALAEAHRRLPNYATKRAIPFYPWLRRIAWEQLLKIHRRHIEAKQRTVLREEGLPLSEDSEMLLVEQVAAASTPSARLLRQEMCQRVRRAIAQLPDTDREVVILKHLEELSFQEAAAVLDVSTQAVYSRYYRAIQRLHRLLNES